MTDQPQKRYESELTVVIDRDKLPPLSTVPGPTIDMLADVRRLQQEDTVTLVACPWCAGCAMVTPEKAAEWRAAYPELSQETE
jgi:hypothetical protein